MKTEIIQIESGEVVKFKVQNSFTAPLRPQKVKMFTQPSLTVPNQTLSLRDLLSRHAMGLEVQQNVPIYDEDGDSTGINPKTLDLVDIQDIKQYHQKQVEDLQIEHAQRKHEFDKKQKEKEMAEHLEKHQKRGIQLDPKKEEPSDEN